MSCFVDVIRPERKQYAVTFDVSCILAGSLFIALLAQISIPLPFSPVPFSMQSLAVLLIGALLGSKKGALAVLAYITEGVLGLPVFAGASFGLVKLLGPTGGYLIGFVLAAFTTGWLLENGWKNSFRLTFFAMFAATLIILSCGATILAFYVGTDKMLSFGVYPFLIGDLLKVFLAASLVPSGWKALNYFKN